MLIEKHGIKIETQFDLYDEVVILNKHTMQLVDFTIHSIELLIYSGMYQQPILQVQYKGTSKHSPNFKSVTVGGMCGEHYILFSTYAEAKKALIDLL